MQSIKHIPLLALAGIFLFHLDGVGATFSSITSGSWHLASTWSSAEAPNGSIPQDGDIIIISQGHTVSVGSGSNTVSIDNEVNIQVFGIIDFNQNSSRLTLENINSTIWIEAGGDIVTSAGGNSETLTIGTASNKTSITDSQIDDLQSPNQVTFTTLETGDAGCAEVGGCDEDPLPVELLFFRGQTVDKQAIRLQWATATEKNFEHFVISHSLNGKDFRSIGRFEGHGDSNIRHDYEFIDRTPYRGLNYYQLKSVDFDGYTEIFDFIAVQLDTNLQLVFYPNPFNGNQLHIKGPDPVNPYEVGVIGMDGRVHPVLSESKTLFFTPSLSAGFYVVKLKLGDQTFEERLIVRN